MSEPSSYFCESCRTTVYAPFVHRCPPGGAHVLVGYPKPLAPDWPKRAKRSSVTEGWDELATNPPEIEPTERVIEMLAPYDWEGRTVIASVPPPPRPREEIVLLDQPKKKQTTTVARAQCDRCGGEHLELVMTKLEHPIQNRARKIAFTHFAICPTTHEPLLLLIFG